MGFRIAPQTPDYRPSKATAPRKDKKYLAWVHELPCVITLTMPVEAAHLSTANALYGHLGRGKGRKASDRWALPLCKEMHDEQHKGDEMKFWDRHGINPYVTALTLWGLWSDKGGDATGEAIKFIQTQRQRQ
jgi:hypothetical protein